MARTINIKYRELDHQSDFRFLRNNSIELGHSCAEEFPGTKFLNTTHRIVCPALQGNSASIFYVKYATFPNMCGKGP